MYLLDTNHCSHLLANHPAVIARFRTLGETHVATCVIVRGELVYGGENSARKAENLVMLQELFKEIDVFPIDDEVANIYGRLKAALVDHFGPKDKRKVRRWIKAHLKENDLWIASVAKRHDYIVVSSDSDFERIREVSDIRVESWVASPPET